MSRVSEIYRLNSGMNFLVVFSVVLLIVAQRSECSLNFPYSFPAAFQSCCSSKSPMHTKTCLVMSHCGANSSDSRVKKSTRDTWSVTAFIDKVLYYLIPISRSLLIPGADRWSVTAECHGPLANVINVCPLNVQLLETHYCNVSVYFCCSVNCDALV